MSSTWCSRSSSCAAAATSASAFFFFAADFPAAADAAWPNECPASRRRIAASALHTMKLAVNGSESRPFSRVKSSNARIAAIVASRCADSRDFLRRSTSARVGGSDSPPTRTRSKRAPWKATCAPTPRRM